MTDRNGEIWTISWDGNDEYFLIVDGPVLGDVVEHTQFFDYKAVDLSSGGIVWIASEALTSGMSQYKRYL